LRFSTGKLRWTRSIGPTAPGDREYWASRGVAVSEQGEFVLFAVGAYTGANVTVSVVSALDGTPRDSSLIVNAVPFENAISGDGVYVVSALDDAGTAGVWAWDESTCAYTLATIASPPFASASGQGWYLSSAELSFDPFTGSTFLGAVWVDGGLLTSCVGMFNVNSPGGAVASYLSPINSALAVDGGAVSCYQRLCAAVLWSGDEPGTQPTVVVLSASDPAPVWNFTSPGSMLSATLAPGPDPDSLYLAAAGCSTVGVCTGPGGDSYLWLLRTRAADQ
jgi:hypothetical protein